MEQEQVAIVKEAINRRIMKWWEIFRKCVSRHKKKPTKKEKNKFERFLHKEI